MARSSQDEHTVCQRVKIGIVTPRFHYDQLWARHLVHLFFHVVQMSSRARSELELGLQIPIGCPQWKHVVHDSRPGVFVAQTILIIIILSISGVRHTTLSFVSLYILCSHMVRTPQESPIVPMIKFWLESARTALGELTHG